MVNELLSFQLRIELVVQNLKERVNEKASINGLSDDPLVLDIGMQFV